VFNLGQTFPGAGTVTSVTGTTPITVNNIDPAAPIIGINAASTIAAGVVQLNDTVASTSVTEAATANAVKTANDAAVAAQGTADTALTNAASAQGTATSAETTANSALTAAGTAQASANDAQATANAALPKTGGTMTGDIVFNLGQTFPGTGTVTSVTGTGAISVTGTSTDPVVNVASASTTVAGVVLLDDTVTSTSVTEAATANAVKTANDAAATAQATADAALPKAGGTMTGDIVFNPGQTFPLTGASGTFTSADNKTITVTNGLITSIV
jgi:hypothetical protein